MGPEEQQLISWILTMLATNVILIAGFVIDKIITTKRFRQNSVGSEARNEKVRVDGLRALKAFSNDAVQDNIEAMKKMKEFEERLLATESNLASAKKEIAAVKKKANDFEVWNKALVLQLTNNQIVPITIEDALSGK
jgi:hypothetical protein